MTRDEYGIYREIYEANTSRIYGYIFRKICDAASTEDLSQDVFIALLFNLSDFLEEYPENAARIKTWLFGVADNKIKLYWRENKKRFDAEVPLDELNGLVDPRDDFSIAEFSWPEWMEEKDKQILTLRARGYSLKEISGRLGVSYEACRQRCARVMRVLEEYYRK